MWGDTKLNTSETSHHKTLIYISDSDLDSQKNVSTGMVGSSMNKSIRLKSYFTIKVGDAERHQ
jgi:hypothetical protein